MPIEIDARRSAEAAAIAIEAKELSRNLKKVSAHPLLAMGLRGAYVDPAGVFGTIHEYGELLALKPC
jgi:hypothetical protein